MGVLARLGLSAGAGVWVFRRQRANSPGLTATLLDKGAAMFCRGWSLRGSGRLAFGQRPLSPNASRRGRLKDREAAGCGESQAGWKPTLRAAFGGKKRKTRLPATVARKFAPDTALMLMLLKNNYFVIL